MRHASVSRYPMCNAPLLAGKDFRICIADLVTGTRSQCRGNHSPQYGCDNVLRALCEAIRGQMQQHLQKA
eukprot:4530155-Amphidinium_carterae.1